MNEYELERERRLAENRRVLESLGIQDAARELAAESARPSTAGKKERKAPRVQDLHTERRRSSRVQGGKICYREDSFFQELRDDEAVTPHTQGPRIANTYLRQLTPEQVEQIRAQHGVQAMTAYTEGRAGGQEVQAAVTQALAEARAQRKPVDSGRGVRIQGGRVYDSLHGITCHWCRQKTLDEHVTCSRPECGGGSRLPVTFCAKCLKNRHGEDQAQAAASGQWVCPPCRGTCGPGCVSCCNCGPCRHKLNLEPTRQIVRFAQSQGFSNAHDYLVHIVTGESFPAIQARKAAFPWGRWMVQGQGQQQQQQEERGASGSSNDASNSDSSNGSASQGVSASPAVPPAPVTPGTEAAAAAGTAAVAQHSTAAAEGTGAAQTEHTGAAAHASAGEAAGAEDAEEQERTATPTRAEAPPTRKRGRPTAAAAAAFRAVKPRVGAQQKPQQQGPQKQNAPKRQAPKQQQQQAPKQKQQKQLRLRGAAASTRRVTRSCAAAHAGAARGERVLRV